MSANKSVAPSLTPLQPLLQGVAKNIVEKVYGPHGPQWGTHFSDIEELAVQIAQTVARHMLDRALQLQADQPVPTADQLCPSCSGPVTAGEPEPRIVTTRAGDTQWNEPSSTCPRCRRAFFPPIEATGH